MGLRPFGAIISSRIFTMVKWWQMDYRRWFLNSGAWTEDRRWTWILVLLGVWPYWRSMVIRWVIPHAGEDELMEIKMEHRLKIQAIEPFLQSAPQVFNFNYLTLTSLHLQVLVKAAIVYCHDLMIFEQIWDEIMFGASFFGGLDLDTQCSLSFSLAPVASLTRAKRRNALCFSHPCLPVCVYYCLWFPHQ